MDGSNGSTIFIDSSLNNFTITPYGAAQISTAQYKFGGASGYFDGIDSVLVTNDISLSTQDFTLECWAYPISIEGTTSIFNQGNDDETGAFTLFNYDGFIGFYADNYDRFLSSQAIQSNQWTHIAFTRQNSIYYLFINGILNVTYSEESFDHYDAPFKIGDGYGGIRYFNGYIDEARVTKGIARYTSNFVPQNKEFYDGKIIKNISIKKQNLGAGKISLYKFVSNIYPSLLLHMNGTNGSTTFTDSSLNNFTMDVVDATISTAVSKFGGASGFFQAGGYIYKDTSVDELKFSGDFCVEMWYYPLALDSDQALYDASLLGQGPVREDAFTLAIDGDGQMYWYHDGTANYTSASPTVGVWNFIAVTRSGSDLRVFLNGTEVLLLTNSVNFSRGGAIIGTITETVGAYSLNGYVDDVRVTKGTARYTSNFTPPTAQF
jgi:hypothetical protein